MPPVSHLLLSEQGRREKPEMAIMANLVLAGQVGQEGLGQGELYCLKVRVRPKDADFCTSGEKAHRMGWWRPEGMPFFAAWTCGLDSSL